MWREEGKGEEGGRKTLINHPKSALSALCLVSRTRGPWEGQFLNSRQPQGTAGGMADCRFLKAKQHSSENLAADAGEPVAPKTTGASVRRCALDGFFATGAVTAVKRGLRRRSGVR